MTDLAVMFSGKTVVVTGASRGIGPAIARAFAGAGASVVPHRGAADGDLRADGAADRLVARALEQTGRLDVLVNNAARQPVAPLDTMTDAEWDEVIDTNLTAAWRCMRAAVRHMQGGCIVNIASIEASHPAAGHGHYAASKAALVTLTRAAALEYGPRGIRVNSVSPGLVARDAIDDEWPEGVDRWLASAPLGRLVQPDEVAAACLFLASPLASAISGHDLVVDAGVSAHPTW